VVIHFKESAMHKPSLEARMAANRNSPSFARLASYYLQEGNIQQAVDLCVEGLKLYPAYATGHLVLGKCYEAMGRHIEAMLAYRRVAKALPDNPVVQALLKTVEAHEQDAFKAFAEDRTRKLKDRKDSITVEQYTAEEATEKESTVDFLLKRLQDVKRSTPRPEPEERRQEEPPAAPPSGPKIVTATLAEIYANQGEYREAIEAYRKLLGQRPVDAERYAKRIAQLEELSKVQQAEQPTRSSSE
jgi:tetratricopeptide (TPR) repeat protein